jgi:outer membrane protein OmpA-like peptidoglycan-associated protein
LTLEAQSSRPASSPRNAENDVAVQIQIKDMNSRLSSLEYHNQNVQQTSSSLETVSASRMTAFQEKCYQLIDAKVASTAQEHLRKWDELEARRRGQNHAVEDGLEERLQGLATLEQAKATQERCDQLQQKMDEQMGGLQAYCLKREKILSDDVKRQVIESRFGASEESRIAALEEQVAKLRSFHDLKDKVPEVNSPRSPRREAHAVKSKDLQNEDVRRKVDAVQAVELRGNIQVDFRRSQVAILKSLEFDLRTTKEEPTAVFSDPCQAQAICRDLAEVAKIFECSVLIEGHTRGGEGEFWQKLAENRALAVAGTMIHFGADSKRLRFQGLPGRLGKNEPKTEVFMDMSRTADEASGLEQRGNKVLSPYRPPSRNDSGLAPQRPPSARPMRPPTSKGRVHVLSAPYF